MILDSDVLILLEKEDPFALSWFAGLNEAPGAAGFAALELLNGCENAADRRRIEAFLSSFTLLWPDEKALDRAAREYGALRLAHGIGVLDMVIAVTSISHGEDLATFNVRHFRGIPDIVTIQPYKR
jgi:predicted nucleic acid-binding protein